jgi:hypothetical protein
VPAILRGEGAWSASFNTLWVKAERQLGEASSFFLGWVMMSWCKNITLDEAERQLGEVFLFKGGLVSLQRKRYRRGNRLISTHHHPSDDA